MIVIHLIAELQKLDPDAKVSVRIFNPKDAAYTDDVSVEVRGGECHISGWVASDNPEAHFPSGD
jgi:hypothetical protein